MLNKIKEIRTAKKISASQIAAACDTTATQIYRLEKGDRELTFEWADKISRVLGVRPFELLNDDSWNPAVNCREEQVLHITESGCNYVSVPLYDISAADGYGSAVGLVTSETVKPLIFEKNYLNQLGSYKNIFGMFVYGDSMHPVLPDGSLILVDRSQKELWQGKMFLLRISTMLYVKYIELLPGRMLLKSANQFYQSIELDLHVDHAEDFEILGRVVWYSCET